MTARIRTALASLTPAQASCVTLLFMFSCVLAGAALWWCVRANRRAALR